MRSILCTLILMQQFSVILSLKMDRSEESSYDARKEVDIVNEWLKNATQKFQSVFI